MPPTKSKAVAPVGTPSANNEEVVRTRDAVITAITGLSSSLDKFAKAYLEHSEAVIENGGVLDIGHAFAPLAKLIPGAVPGAFATTSSAFAAVNGADTLASDEHELDADGKKKKRKRNTKPRDPNAPKRPMTAYFRFMKEQRPVLTEQLKNEPIAEDGSKYDINKLATERWKALSDEEREQYAAAYRKDRQGYEAEMRSLGIPVGKADMHELAEEDLAAVTSSMPVGPGAHNITDEEEPLAEDESDSDEETVPVIPAPAPKSRSSAAAAAKPSTTTNNTTTTPAPESAKKTPRQTKKKSTPAAASAADTTSAAAAATQPKSAAAAQTTSSSDPPAPAASSSSPVRKRKAAKTETDSAPKKRGRKSNADKVAEAEADAAAASAQLEGEQPVAAKGKKDKKKKRKSEVE